MRNFVYSTCEPDGDAIDEVVSHARGRLRLLREPVFRRLVAFSCAVLRWLPACTPSRIRIFVSRGRPVEVRRHRYDVRVRARILANVAGGACAFECVRG